MNARANSLAESMRQARERRAARMEDASKESLTFREFDDAADPRFETAEALHGLSFDRTSDELRSLAYHEAGHACIALTLGVEVFYATIRPRYEDAGHVLQQAIGTLTVHDALLITLAGPSAQRRHFPLLRVFADDLEDPMGRYDTAQARALLRALHGSDSTADDAITDALAQWRTRADRVVERHWPWIKAVAEALEQRQRLSGDEIAQLNPKRGQAR